MKKSLTLKENILVGSLLFGLFFGAGNLIFPVELGQQSGSNVILSTVGFLISGVGLAVLGVIASAISKSDSLYEMAQPVSNNFAVFFTCLLYLTIGPFFAIPRTASVAFEVGVRAFFGDENISLLLLVFSGLFFIATLGFSLKPVKLIDTIGKYMTPIFLVLLSILVIFSIFRPMGELGIGQIQERYIEVPLLKGLVDGYNTMDALAALAFAIIIITNIRNFGVTNPKDIAIETVKSGIFCIIGMGVVYTSLSFMGSTSSNIMEIGENGGIILSNIANFYLDSSGKLLLAGIVIVACLKTAIGLITACSQMFVEMFPRLLSYKGFAVVFTLISFLIANLGLSSIISLSLPVLMFLYPMAIVLILLSLFAGIVKRNSIIYKSTMGFTLIAAIFDFINAAPDLIKNNSTSQKLLEFGSYLPGFEIGFGWFVPSLIGFLIGVIIVLINKKGNYSYRN